MHFCGFRLYGEGGARIDIKDWATMIYKLPDPKTPSEADADAAVPKEKLAMIEEEKKVKQEERCGHAWLRGISYGWGKQLNACNPFRGSNARFPGNCFHTGTVPPEGPTWKLNLDRPRKVNNFNIANRGECCSERLRGNKVYYGDENYKPVLVGTLDGRKGWQGF